MIHLLRDSAFIQNVEFQAMDKDAFRGLQTLRHLRLDDNSFMDVPTPSLAHVSNLRELKVGSNPFKTLRDGSFRGLRALRSLGLSACPALKTIESGAFRGCSDLEKVTITQNRKLRHIAGKDRLIPKQQKIVKLMKLEILIFGV